MDVFDKIKDLLTFESEDDFYFLQILQRKKDGNPFMNKNSRIIKNYYIDNLQYLEDHYDEIRKLCCAFNARATIRLNKRSYKKVALKTLEKISTAIVNGNFKSIKNAYQSACGTEHSDPNKTWIVDIDDVSKDDIASFSEFIKFIEECKPRDKKKVITTLSTRSGVHIITKPFDLKAFKNHYPQIDVHKDNPINLYIP